MAGGWCTDAISSRSISRRAAEAAQRRHGCTLPCASVITARPPCLPLSPPQVPRLDVFLADDPRLQDGMQQRWPPEAVAEHVAQAVQRLRPDRVRGDGGGRRQEGRPGFTLNRQSTAAAWAARPAPHPPPPRSTLQVYTFDAGGVSGHPNHRDTCAGVLHWWTAAPSSSNAGSLPQLWQLETVRLHRKYLAVADAPLSWALTKAAGWARRGWRRQGGQRAWHMCRQPRRAWRALGAHRSQMVW